MSNMQAFRKQLLTTADANNVYKRHLVRLMQVSRAQVVNVTDELTWFIWKAEKAATA